MVESDILRAHDSKSQIKNINQISIMQQQIKTTKEEKGMFADADHEGTNNVLNEEGKLEFAFISLENTCKKKKRLKQSKVKKKKGEKRGKRMFKSGK